MAKKLRGGKKAESPSPETSQKQQRQSPSTSQKQQRQSPSASQKQQRQSPSASQKQQRQSPSPTQKQQRQSPSPTQKQQRQSPSPTQKQQRQSPRPTQKQQRQSPNPTQKQQRQSPAVTPVPPAPGETANSGDPVSPLEVAVTPLENLLSMRRPQQIAVELANSLISLRKRLAELELEKMHSDGGAALPTLGRRTRDKEVKLELEIAKTEKMMRRLLLMTRVVDRIVDMRETVVSDARVAMESEVVALRAQVVLNEELIRARYVSRVNMLHRYWLWRTLQELGDVTVGRTFEDELARGPRYRTVGLQNNILSDTLEQQLVWLRRFAEKEEVFRAHVRRLDNLVEELTDVNEALEETLTCRVCGLLFEDPVVFWPCGHTFCLVCFDSLTIAPSLFRCPTCGSIGSEGYVHNLLIAESVAKWVFKEAGYADIHGALSLVRLHLSKFRKDVIMTRIASLREQLAAVRDREARPEELAEMSITFRAF
ncbi:hypothetical protein DQ04_08411040 [Trypanosoma grayi]|uniref:hypothetical protein n=1 Tax=Trypanosoma grayi TaxID=71804 RepID=UPI0004F43953|nr:hypothetical protein DQ04_08411040 [Trypanosoma grayi]KEG07948.1 hypothetical protein DQ04_08411040 [Trypanosoma grayi]